ncbi:MAG: hypothetical protein ABJD66_00765 [Cellulophaga sp.]|uniref:hypothetical protein n=1 Tax=unclassified Cellulophaga TaxID=2634405 RepID=UPI000C2C3C43|nr:MULTISPECIES: hypothetical protein [unclassified Cellulophaga]MDO6492668.1 hypothetical protein [Cellulophaga sp. 2_MG-2023]MDO6495925.1 hypothetical protein [Cellulophaga sp. 3_MG-2023]PKB43511.1 hypothetical protein AX016_1712 [Cellulophaga sp. RHA19]
MKLLFCFWILLFNTTTNCSNLDSVRSQFHTIKTNDDLKKFIKTCEDLNCELATPYVASCIMKKAEFTIWPFKKLAYFNEGKKELESYIKKYPNDLEARYVRYLVQSNIPSFLGYNTRIAADKKFITDNLETSKLPVNYKKIILKNINTISPN